MFLRPVLCSLLLGLAVLASRVTPPPSVLHRRTYFYVKGEYIEGGPSFVAHRQIYVEHLVPAKVTQPLPMLIVHGHSMTGTNFLNTPDGRLGWADYFMGKGYELFIIDQPARGRSAWQPDVDGTVAAYDTLTIEQHFTAGQLFNLWPQAHLHTQWPGNGTKGDPVFDAFYMSMVQSLVNETLSQQEFQAGAGALMDKIGPAIVLTHSEAGSHGWILGDARPNLVKAIITMEPFGPPFSDAVFGPVTPDLPYGLTEVPLTFSPPITSPADLHPVPIYSDPAHNFTCFQQGNNPPRKLINLVNIPTLVITSESSYHQIFEWCSVKFLQQAGMRNVKHVPLQNVGIHGNAHMMFMEKNNIEIAEDVVEKWIDETLGW